MFRVAVHFLESEEEAQDALQDLYVKLWNSRETLDAVHNPRGYCLTMMKNLCLDRLRKIEKKNASDMPPDMVSAERADATVQTREQMKRIRDAIDRLPEAQREVVQMKILQGLSYKEMEELTGKAQLTLRVLFSNAKKRLNSLL